MPSTQDILAILNKLRKDVRITQVAQGKPICQEHDESPKPEKLSDTIQSPKK